MSSRTDLALDALEAGLWTRQREDRDPQDSAHHSEKGEHCPALHPALADAHPSVGTAESRRVVYDVDAQLAS